MRQLFDLVKELLAPGWLKRVVPFLLSGIINGFRGPPLLIVNS
jgi:hypothetical protein